MFASLQCDITLGNDRSPSRSLLQAFSRFPPQHRSPHRRSLPFSAPRARFPKLPSLRSRSLLSFDHPRPFLPSRPRRATGGCSCSVAGARERDARSC